MQALLNLSGPDDSPIERCSTLLMAVISNPDYSGPDVDASTNGAIQKVAALLVAPHSGYVPDSY
jgi:hypothetical protein